MEIEASSVQCAAMAGSVAALRALVRAKTPTRCRSAAPGVRKCRTRSATRGNLRSVLTPPSRAVWRSGEARRCGSSAKPGNAGEGVGCRSVNRRRIRAPAPLALPALGHLVRVRRLAPRSDIQAGARADRRRSTHRAFSDREIERISSESTASRHLRRRSRLNCATSPLSTPKLPVFRTGGDFLPAHFRRRPVFAPRTRPPSATSFSCSGPLNVLNVDASRFVNTRW
jgi:hypothetical protein